MTTLQCLKKPKGAEIETLLSIVYMESFVMCNSNSVFLHNPAMFSFSVTFSPPSFFVPVQNEVKRIDFTEAFHSFAVSQYLPLFFPFFICSLFACSLFNSIFKRCFLQFLASYNFISVLISFKRKCLVMYICFSNPVCCCSCMAHL